VQEYEKRRGTAQHSRKLLELIRTQPILVGGVKYGRKMGLCRGG
jgi:hypothetical protein